MRSPFRRAKTSDADAASHVFDAEKPMPEAATYVVGDLHGREDLLEPIFERIDRHIGEAEASNPFLIFVGDYIDYGTGSRETLLRLRALTEEFPRNVICLMGNHERMMLDFLSDPTVRGARWLKAGGVATLQSFGVPEPERSPTGYAVAAGALQDAMDTGLLDWLAARPLSWNSGNLWAVHAAADPNNPMASQSARVLLWGHPEFEVVARTDGAWVIHGHTEVEQPVTSGARINVDTAAWKTGRLTAAAIMPSGEIEFIST